MVRLILNDGHNKLIATIKTGTKNVAKTMKSITEGTVKDRGTKWFPELSDKRITNICFFILYKYNIFYRKKCEIHIYWCMKNCNDSPEILRSLISNICDHYKVSNHTYRISSVRTRAFY